MSGMGSHHTKDIKRHYVFSAVPLATLHWGTFGDRSWKKTPHSQRHQLWLGCMQLHYLVPSGSI
jgi:hypothetical protein